MHRSHYHVGAPEAWYALFMIRLAKAMSISNVWLLEHRDERFLFDTGYSLERPILRQTLWKWGIRQKGDLTAVVLTHRHSDHAANAAWLRRTFDAPIVCHEADAPILEGRAPAPKICGLANQHLHERLLCYIEDRAPARSKVDEELSEGRWRKSFRVLHVPGHTEGSMMLLHEPTQTLFSGDAILAGIAPLRFFEKLSLAMPGFSLDIPEVHARTKQAIALVPDVKALCSGHGPMITEATSEKLRRLAGR